MTKEEAINELKRKYPQYSNGAYVYRLSDGWHWCSHASPNGETLRKDGEVYPGIKPMEVEQLQ